MKRRLSFLGTLLITVGVLISLLIPLLLNGGPKSADQLVKTSDSSAIFIKKIAPEAQKLGKSYGVMPSILIAQALVETDSGRTLLGVKYHNLYHLPASEGNRRVVLWTTEVKDGKEQNVERSYQVYSTWSESMADYMTRLKANNLGYEMLYTRLATAKTYKEASAIFYQEGYTTSSDYAGRLIALIEKHQLEQYDKQK